MYYRNNEGDISRYSVLNSRATQNVTSTCFASLSPNKIVWLIDGFIPTESLTILAGEPGVGKSSLAYNIAAAISNNNINQSWPTKTAGGHVLIFSAEDHYANVITPRLVANAANLEKNTDS